jgi:hypothetical protein
MEIDDIDDKGFRNNNIKNSRRRCEDNNRIDGKDLIWEDMCLLGSSSSGFGLFADSFRKGNETFNSVKSQNSFTSCTSVRFSRTITLHRIN